MKKIDFIIIVFIIFSSLYTLKDLQKPKMYTSHDGIHQIVRFYYFDKAIEDGHFPPRWASGLQNGYGYPLFSFSYHLPWYIAEGIHWLGFNIFQSVKNTFLIGFILSGIFMYFYQREIFGRIPAILGTIFYLFAPYRFLNIFVRAAIGDATIFIFPPIIFLSIWKIKKSPQNCKIWICFGALAIAGMILSHAMVFLLFGFSIIAYIIFSLFVRKGKIRFVGNSTIVLLLGFGIASYYFIPSIIERNLTIFSTTFSSAFGNDMFLKIKELIYSPWGYGMMHAKEGGMSFQIGIPHIIILLTSLFIFLIRAVSNKFRTVDKEAGFFIFISFVAIFLMLPSSLFIWKMIFSIAVIDFPWRIMAVVIFGISFLAGYLASIISFLRIKIIFTFLFICITIYSNRNHTRINESLPWPLDFYLKLEKTTNSFDEYNPKWVDRILMDKPRSKIETNLSDSKIEILKNTTNNLDFVADLKSKDEIRINTIYYPGWELTSDGKKQDFRYKDTGGPMIFSAQPGKHHYALKFKETPLRIFSNWISLVTIMIVAVILIQSNGININKKLHI